MRTITGIGSVASAVLVALMPELGKRSYEQIVTLAGLAPINSDSGISRG